MSVSEGANRRIDRIAWNVWRTDYTGETKAWSLSNFLPVRTTIALRKQQWSMPSLIGFLLNKQ